MGNGLGCLSVLLLAALWQVVSSVCHTQLLPGPLAVLADIWRLTATGDLLGDFARTLLRAVTAFVISMLLGSILGIVLGRNRLLDGLFGNWVLVALNMPAVIVGILVYIWLGLTDLALILAVVLSKAPLVITTVRQGVRSMRGEFDQLALGLALPLKARVLRVMLPQLVPYLLTAARNGLALVWKLVLVFEVLGSDGGVGFRTMIFFQNFDVTGILAYALCFTAIVLAAEALLLSPLEQRLLRWQVVEE